MFLVPVLTRQLSLQTPHTVPISISYSQLSPTPLPKMDSTTPPPARTQTQFMAFFFAEGTWVLNSAKNASPLLPKTSFSDVLKKKAAMIWYDECFLRYSDRSIFSLVERNPMLAIYNTQNTTQQDLFNKLVAETVNNAIAKAANARSGAKKFGTEVANFTSFHTLYSLVQCTPDLSEADCNRCLRQVIGYLPDCCSGKKGAQVLTPSCSIRYDLYPFYNLMETEIAASPPSPPFLSPPPPSLTGPKGKVIAISQFSVVIKLQCF